MAKAKSAKERTSRLDGDDFSAYFSLLRTLWWLVLTPLAYFMGWLNSVVFVSLLSIWALVETAFAAYRSDRNKKLDRKMDEINKKLDLLLGQRRV